MALIYPHDTTANNEPEQWILDRLRAELNDEWTILHSLRLARHRDKRAGEADFVAFTMDCLVVIEVKGGVVSVRRGAWSQNAGPLDSPVEQAWGNFFSLECYLKEHGWHGLPGGALCLFPDSQFHASSADVLTAEWEPFQCQGAREIAMLGMAAVMDDVRKRYIAKWQALRGTPPRLSDAEAELLLSLLRPTLLALPFFGRQIEKDRQRLADMDDRQYEFLTCIDKPRMLIDWPAGSGKTVLGYKACKNWLRRNPGKKAAMICVSTYLAKDLYRWVLRDGLAGSLFIYCAGVLQGAFWSDTFKRKTEFAIEHAGCIVREDGRVMAFVLGGTGVADGRQIDVDDFKGIIHNCAKEGFFESALLPPLGIDLIEEEFPEFDFRNAEDFVVIDEGQDFRGDPVALAFLNLRVKGGLHKGNVIWMQDFNQYVPAEPGQGIGQGHPVCLPESWDYHAIPRNCSNYRNPHLIGILSSNLLDDVDSVQARGATENEKPILLVDAKDGLARTLHVSLHHAIRAGVSLRDIVIVSVTGLMAQELRRVQRLGEISLTYEADVYTQDTIDAFPVNTVRWSTLFDIKGREFPVIMLIDLPDLDTEIGRAQAYVASTRATSYLYVVGEASSLAAWRRLL